MSGKASITKITRPNIKGIISRQRLFRKLHGEHGHSIIWITGPPGSGKTTLVASYLETRKLPCLWYRLDEADADVSTFFYYMGIAAKTAAPRCRKPMPLLTPEYAFGIPIFAKRYFEELFIRLKPPLVLVFDNYQDVSPESIFHEVIREGFTNVPEGIRVIIASRSDPPEEFARLRAGNGFLSLGWDEIRFSEEEYKDIIRSQNLGKIPYDILSGLHQKTQGWVSGLMLLLEQARYRNISPESINSLADLSQTAVFDYFAGEILRKMDEGTQFFLLETALLPEMTPSMAEKLTGNKLAGRILSRLSGNHFFTERHQTGEPGYRYHSMFREFLLARLGESAGPGEIELLRNRAAFVLEEAGHIEDAASLYSEVENWEMLAPLILRHAQSLLKQGRNATLKGWLRSMPEKALGSDPWLLYWLGVSRMGYDLAGARSVLEKAFGQFTGMGDEPGMALSWSCIVDAVILEWNDFHPLDELTSIYFERIEKIVPAIAQPVQARVMTAMGLALMNRKPDHPGTASFFDKAVAIALNGNDMDTGLYAMMNANLYYHWVGDSARCDALIEHVGRLALSSHALQVFQLWSYVMHAGRHLWNVESMEEADRSISEALEFGAKTGLHLWDHILYALGVYSSLMRGEMSKAREYLGEMGAMLTLSRKEVYVIYHFLSCSYQFAKGNFPGALREAESALKFSMETGHILGRIVVLHGMAQALHALKDSMDQDYLEQALGLAVRAKSTILEFGCRLARAQFAFDGGEQENGIEFLREALSLGKKHGYYYLLWWWDPAAMAKLSAKALENNIEPGYVKELIRLRNLIPDGPPIYIESWPWPLKVYTLGKFEIIRDDTPVLFNGKVQHKPLEMLKVMIALGGQGISEEQLSDALWPEAEGDAAHVSFSTTLHRLRKLTGNERAIQLQEGRVTLDRRYCWVDIWAFERALESSCGPKKTKEKYPQHPDIKTIEDAIALYKGQFLPADDAKHWSVSTRKRMESKFLCAIRAVCGHYEKSGEPERAVEYLQRGLEADELAEDLYRGLMTCYDLMGRRPDAMSAYERCREALSAVLGIAPSAGTEKLKEKIFKNR